MMLQEAGEFASHLKKIEKDIRGLKNATESACGWGQTGGRCRRAGGWPGAPHACRGCGKRSCLPLLTDVGSPSP